MVLDAARVYHACMKSVRLGPFLLMESVLEQDTFVSWRGVHPERSLPVWVSVSAADFDFEKNTNQTAALRGRAPRGGSKAPHDECRFEY